MIKKMNHFYFKPTTDEMESVDSIIFNSKVSSDLIIDLSSINSIEKLNLSMLLKVNEYFVSRNFCMVLVTDSLSSIPDEESLNIVPSLVEAEDYIQMEQIQRDLGI
jgi:hypothetical protein